jgi:hypothetical protein
VDWRFTTSDAWVYLASEAALLLTCALLIIFFRGTGGEVSGRRALVFIPMVLSFIGVMSLALPRAELRRPPAGFAQTTSPLGWLVEVSIVYLMLLYGAGLPGAVRTLKG